MVDLVFEHVLDINEVCWSIHPPPHSVFHQPVLGVINKDCIQAECLYSSQIQHPNCEGTGVPQLPT